MKKGIQSNLHTPTVDSGFLFPYSHKIDTMVSSKYTCCLLSSKNKRSQKMFYQRIKEIMNSRKMMVLTFSDSKETVFQRAISLMADKLQIKAEQQHRLMAII